MVPMVHANWRYFEMYDKEGKLVDQWFGGGQDLTLSICSMKMSNTFIRFASMPATVTIQNFTELTSQSVTNISGTPIEMKPEGGRFILRLLES
jgi:hypothetical protein